MVSRRQVKEEGHRRKFLAVVDGTDECSRAIKYAARRSAAIDADLVLVYVIEPQDFQHWLGVEQKMRAEALEEGERLLAHYSALVIEWANIHAEQVVREGPKSQEIIGLIEDDRDIALLILAAGNDNDGPGPLVSSIAGNTASFPIPVTVVPSTLTDEDIDHLV